MSHISIKSPSSNKAIELTFDRELHFGPFLFKVKPVGFFIKEVIDAITENVVWSDDNKYLVVVEVVHDNSSSKNISNLLLIDTDSGKTQKIDLHFQTNH